MTFFETKIACSDIFDKDVQCNSSHSYSIYLQSCMQRTLSSWVTTMCFSYAMAIIILILGSSTNGSQSIALIEGFKEMHDSAGTYVWVFLTKLLLI